VLQGFLDRPRLYGTERFHSALEQRARKNIERSLARLGD
jgi:predicted metal-dependent HD superfamily phosphohydrolase